MLKGTRKNVEEIYNLARNRLSQLCSSSRENSFDFPKNSIPKANVWLGFTVWNDEAKLQMHLYGKINEEEPLVKLVRKFKTEFNMEDCSGE